jgi:lysophospholipase L1-like esterase
MNRESKKFWSFLLIVLVCIASMMMSESVENPEALSSFFRALDSIKSSGPRIDPVRIVHFGDSHTAADILTAAIRKRFQRDFGDGGPGYLIARNPFSTPRRGVVSGATPGWVIDGIGTNAGNDGSYGLAGISMTAYKANERIWLQTACTHFEVYYLRSPGGGTIDITVDGASVLDEPLSLNSDQSEPGYGSYDLPDGNDHRLEIVTLKPGKVRILGIVAERIAPSPGISYDVLGINGARAVRLTNWNQEIFLGNIKQRQPDLIIIAYGTNEVTDGDWSVESYARMFSGILKKFQKAAPKASILVFGPPDRADVPSALNKMPLMIEAQRRAAKLAGAAFWCSYDAMGGAGSMNSWVALGLGQGDHVHLTSPGYLKLGDMFYEDLSRAYAASRSRLPPPTKRARL